MHFQPIQFGERIRKLRREHHLTQEQLAAMLNISVEHLRKIELGKRGISIDLLLDLSYALEVSSDFLLSGVPRTTYSVRMLIAQIRELLDRVESSEVD